MTKDIVLAKTYLKALSGSLMLRKEKAKQRFELKPSQNLRDLTDDLTRLIEMSDEVHNTFVNLDESHRKVVKQLYEARATIDEQNKELERLKEIEKNVNL